MQGIYNHIPETNFSSRAHRVAAVLYLQFTIHIMLFTVYDTYNVICHVGCFVFAQQ